MSLDDDTLRALLATRTPGEWRVSSYHADDPPEVWARREGEADRVACIDSPIDEMPGPEASANADLCALAPALAAEVLRLSRELAFSEAKHRVVLRASCAHLAADDALSLARRTDAADVPTAEARALAARECLAGLVGYVAREGGR